MVWSELTGVNSQPVDTGNLAQPIPAPGWLASAYGLLKALPVAPLPWHTISLDSVGRTESVAATQGKSAAEAKQVVDSTATRAYIDGSCRTEAVEQAPVPFGRWFFWGQNVAAGRKPPIVAGLETATLIISLATELAVPPLVGAWVDGRFGTTPWGTLVGALLGMVAFATGLGRFLRRLERRSRDTERR